MIGTRDRVPTDKSISVNADLEAHRQAAVASLGEFALRGASQDRLISHAVAACADLLPADFVKVLELLPGGRELLLRAGKGWNEGVVGLATVPNDAGSQAGFTLLEDEPVLVHDLELETRFTAPQLLTDHAVRSGISVVIRENGRPFGVLAVHSQIPGAFQESDAQFMRSLANVMGSAFQQRKSEDELRALAEISRVITSSTDIREVYAQFAALANELVPFDRLVIAIYDAEAETLTDQYAAGVEVAGWSEGNTHPLRGTALEAVVRERIPFIATGLDDSEPMEHPARPASAKVGLPAMLAVPLVSRDRVIGTLNLKAATPGAYIDADAALARQVADQIAGAIAASETSRRYRDLYDNAPDMYFSVDGASGRITRCNKTALDALGYSREEIIGMPVVDLYHSSVQDHARELLARFRQTGEISGAELKAVRKNGTVLDISLSVTAIRGPDGNIVSSRSTLRDITARKKSEADYRDLVETAHELVWRCDAEGRFTYLNPSWERTHGYTVDEMLGRPFTDFQTSETAERATREFSSHLAGGSVIDYETHHIAKSGEEITLLFNAFPVINADGKIVGTRGTARDVTAERKAQWRLGERLKELTCLYGVVDLLRDGSPIEKVAWDIANLIPLGWQYPDIAVARVSFDQLSFQTEAFVSTEWKLASDIIVDGQTRGLVEICYTEPKPLADEGPFLAEERNLIDRIAKLLADAIESRAAGERVRLQGAAVDASVDAIIAANRSGEIMLANPAAAAMFGRATAADLVGTALLNLMPEGFRADHLQGLARLNRGDSPKVLGRTIEVEGLKADGQIFPLEISINKLDGSGKADYVAVLRDITERRETERASRLRSAALGAASDMIVITGSDGVIEYVNDAFTRETGYTPAEVVGANPRTWKSETQDPAYYIQLWSTIKAGRVWKGELINRRKNGTVFIEEMTITPIHDADGKISNFVAIKRDISERKRNEEDLLRLATTDTLTGLLNRHQFNVQLKQAVELLRRREAQGALITMDLDGFKYINDAWTRSGG